jgi:hypothetical protein
MSIFDLLVTIKQKIEIELEFFFKLAILHVFINAVIINSSPIFTCSEFEQFFIKYLSASKSEKSIANEFFSHETDPVFSHVHFCPSKKSAVSPN